MDKLAVALGMDRIELRRLNLIGPGEAVTTTQIVPVVSARECLDRAMEGIGWEGRSYETDKPWLKRGYGVSVICFGLGYGDGFPDTSRARVRFNDQDRRVDAMLSNRGQQLFFGCKVGSSNPSVRGCQVLHREFDLRHPALFGARGGFGVGAFRDVDRQIDLGFSLSLGSSLHPALSPAR